MGSRVLLYADTAADTVFFASAFEVTCGLDWAESGPLQNWTNFCILTRGTSRNRIPRLLHAGALLVPRTKGTLQPQTKQPQGEEPQCRMNALGGSLSYSSRPVSWCGSFLPDRRTSQGKFGSYPNPSLTCRYHSERWPWANNRPVAPCSKKKNTGFQQGSSPPFRGLTRLFRTFTCLRSQCRHN